MNIISTTTILKQPTRLFILSNLFAFISLCIHGEFFIADIPNVHYTLIVGICIFLFSIFVLFKIIIALIVILDYGIMKDIHEDIAKINCISCAVVKYIY